MPGRALPYVCGHCGFASAVAVSVESPDGWVDEGGAVFRTIAACDHCGGVSYLEVTAPEVQVPGVRGGIARHPGESFFNYKLAVVRQYPGPFSRPPSETPDDVAASYISAQRCLWAGSPDGAAVLCRRALEIAARQQGIQAGNLIQMIEALGKQGKLSADLVSLGHGIRVLGNEGAHFSGQAFRGLSDADAESVIKFTEAFLNGLYSIPALAKKAAGRRAGP